MALVVFTHKCVKKVNFIRISVDGELEFSVYRVKVGMECGEIFICACPYAKDIIDIA